VAGKPSHQIDDVLRLPVPLRLHYGDELPDARAAFRLVGPEDAPVIAVLGGISAHRIVAGAEGEGWWPEIVGPGLGVDTRHYRILGMDYLGGRGNSSTPQTGGKFPPLSSYDQADALRAIVRHLKLKPLHAIVGASYGGMVALCFAERYAELVNHIVVLSAADKSQVLSTAWRSVQRQIVREAIARGDDYVQKYRAESFLVLSESIDLHQMDATAVHTPATLIAVREDQLVPFNDMQALSARLNGPRQLIEINSIFGHDAFLKEGAALTPIIKATLAEHRT